ncbi:MAG: amidohydrolase family protein, partial [Caulobacterales bacterium]|nr:amidohydrolase family protein [Caulobacterales bacterium]
MTIKNATAAMLATALLGACTHSSVAAGGADLIFAHGRGKTPDGWAEALAVRGEEIVAVGSNDEVAALAGERAERVDLAGQVVLPGFHDRHVHPLFGGTLQSGLTYGLCEIAQGATADMLRERVAACVEEVEPGDWVSGGQWDASTIGRVPDKGMLDPVTPDNPVLIRDTSGHSALANSAALTLAGVTKDTPDPEGGIIERDASGAPTGVLRETAIGLVQRHVPRPTLEQIRPPMEWALERMLEVGVTSFTEASLGFVGGIENEAKLYAALADDGVLKHRARLCMTWSPANEPAEAVIAARADYARERVAPDCVKIFLDGVPTDSHTAAMLEPYGGVVEGRDDAASEKGLLLIDQEVVNEAVTRFDAMGLTVKFHAAGDAAVRAGLDAVAAARAANGDSGLSHNV